MLFSCKILIIMKVTFNVRIFQNSNKNGNYSVMHTYNVATMRYFNNNHCSSSCNSLNAILCTRLIFFFPCTRRFECIVQFHLFLLALILLRRYHITCSRITVYFSHSCAFTLPHSSFILPCLNILSEFALICCVFLSFAQS